MKWFSWFNNLLIKLKLRRPPVPLVPEPAPPLPATEPPVDSIYRVHAAPIGEQQPKPKRRKTKRYDELEKARMKHDEWVKPKGTPPIHHPRENQPQPVAPPAREFDLTNPDMTTVTTNSIDFHDRYHTTGEQVLYRESELYGEFNFRDTILEQLPLYWQYLARMKARDPDMFGLLRQVGVTLVPYITKFNTYKNIRKDPIQEVDKKYSAYRIAEMKKDIYISDWFNKHRPGFGAVATALTLPDEAEMMMNKYLLSPRFLYFAKYSKPPVEIQPVSSGDVYLLTIWWDNPNAHGWARKGGAAEEFAVHVSADGKTIRCLKQRINEKTWVYPNNLKAWAKRKGIDCNTFVAHHFTQAVRVWELTQFSMVRVMVSKGNMSIAFGVAHERLPYFFKDRDYQLNINGRQKKIIHWVPPFVKANGKAVKGHFRGERSFTWADYKVEISIPGHDYVDIFREFDVGMMSMTAKEQQQCKRDLMKPPAIGRWMVNIMHGRQPRWRRPGGH